MAKEGGAAQILVVSGPRSDGALVRSEYGGMGSTRHSARAHSYALLRSMLTTAIDDKLLTANRCRIPDVGQAPQPHRRSACGVLRKLQRIADAMPERYRPHGSAGHLMRLAVR